MKTKWIVFNKAIYDLRSNNHFVSIVCHIIHAASIELTIYTSTIEISIVHKPYNNA